MVKKGYYGTEGFSLAWYRIKLSKDDLNITTLLFSKTNYTFSGLNMPLAADASQYSQANELGHFNNIRRSKL